MKLLRVVVVGTGTEIGKMHVTTCLLSYARAQGRRGRAYKPIATGIDRACEDAVRHPEALAAPYLPTRRSPIVDPIHPLSQAREEARPIDLDATKGL